VRAFARRLDEAPPRGPRLYLVDVPLCATESLPWAARGGMEGAVFTSFEEIGRATLRRTRVHKELANRAKRNACCACRYNPECLGVWRDYLEVHGWGGLEPVAPAPVAVAPRSPRGPRRHRSARHRARSSSSADSDGSRSTKLGGEGACRVLGVGGELGGEDELLAPPDELLAPRPPGASATARPGAALPRGGPRATRDGSDVEMEQPSRRGNLGSIKLQCVALAAPIAELKYLSGVRTHAERLYLSRYQGRFGKSAAF
jgi:hypothetical protein